MPGYPIADYISLAFFYFHSWILVNQYLNSGCNGDFTCLNYYDAGGLSTYSSEKDKVSSQMTGNFQSHTVI